MKKFIIMPFIITVLLTGCNTKTETSTSVVTTNTPEIVATETPKAATTPTATKSNKLIKKVGETTTFSKDGVDLFTLTVTSVEATDERSEYSKEKPVQVVKINYIYENLNYDEDVFIGNSNMRVIDGDGNVCNEYSVGDRTLIPKSTPMGAKCTAQEAFSLMSDKPNFKLMYSPSSFIAKNDSITYELNIE